MIFQNDLLTLTSLLMGREGKGTGVRKHVDNYCIVDLETTGVFINSAKIIEISALKVRENKVVEEYSTLVNPQCHIPPLATAVNHITDEMVKNAPILEDVIDSFISFLGDDVIIGYNNAGFDMNLIYDALLDIRRKTFGNDYIDILHVARRCLSDLDNHKLETVSMHYQLDTKGEHRALKDCYLTKDCYDRLYAEYGDDAFGRKDSDRHHRTIHYSAETLSLRKLQSLLEAIINDGQVTLVEISELKAWIENHRDLQGYYPFDRVFDALDKVLEDGMVTPEELEDLQILFSDFVDPVKSHASVENIPSIVGKHIVVTGDFEFGSRAEVCALIEAAGGINDSSVKKATNYVVVGAKGSENWKAGNYGGKIQKAMEMKKNGENIEIVEECNFIPVIKRIIEEGIDSLTEKAAEDAFKMNWQQNVRDMLEQLVSEYELPSGSLYLSDNYGLTENTRDEVISHTVCIWEPDYPPIPSEKPGQNKLVVTIIPSKVKNRPNDLDLNIREVQEGDLHEFLPDDAEVLPQTKSDLNSGTIRIRIKSTSPNLTEYIRQNTIYCIKGYVSKAARFGCCSSFMDCSDAKKCVHENKLYSKACMYRINLDQGRIFYGKNRNIDG